MNERVNKFLLEDVKFMPEMHLRLLDSRTVLADQLLKTKNEYKI